MVTASKPTVRANDPAQLRALQQGHNYTVTRTATGWTVAKKTGEKEYHVTLDGRCDCRHFTQRLESTGATCKHFSMANLAEQLGLVLIPAPAKPASTRGKLWSEKTREERLREMSNGCDF